VPEVLVVALRNIRRFVAPALVAVALGSTAGTAATVALPTAAFADSTASMESQFIAKMNAARQANGQRPYSVASDLTAVARAHSANMASQQSLYHNPSLTTDVHNWQAVGENVGEGPDVTDIHDAFMHSPEHRANILDHDFTEVGVGVSVDSQGTVWVTEDFREPMSSSSTTSTHSTTSHTSPATSSTTSHSAPTWSSATPTHARSARPVLSPRQVLLRRLHELRHHHARPVRSDPVAQSFVYLANLSRLAG
jgi:uncharacterized protein YkwD